jgi:hypothetical protein
MRQWYHQGHIPSHLPLRLGKQGPFRTLGCWFPRDPSWAIFCCTPARPQSQPQQQEEEEDEEDEDEDEGQQQQQSPPRTSGGCPPS